MSELLQRIESEIQFRRLLAPRQNILLAVSGGVDSMVLLHVLHSLAPKNRWHISVVHFNHQLRGRASLADEKLVGAVAKKLALPFFCGRGAVKPYSQQAKISVEMAARKLRHEFLARVARKQKIATIALAHHADDQVELFFLRLLRGAGGEGLAGMKWRSPSPVAKRITLVRPLLACAKTELAVFAGENKIQFREDATNNSNDFLRNRIRNELLPLLHKDYQPGLTKTVLRLMEITGAETEFVSETAQHIAASRWGDSVRPPTGEQDFVGLPVAVQRKLMQQQLQAHGVAGDFELIEQLRQAPEKWVSVNAGLLVRRDVLGKLIYRGQGGKEFNAAELKLPSRSGRVTFASRQFCWRVKPFNGIRETAPSQTESFDVGKIGAEIILRHWRLGDRFQPIGMKSAVKLQDLFVNAKIPAVRRRELALATTATGEIFWVEGLRIGERFKLTPSTRQQLVWHCPKYF